MSATHPFLSRPSDPRTAAGPMRGLSTSVENPRLSSSGSRSKSVTPRTSMSGGLNRMDLTTPTSAISQTPRSMRSGGVSGSFDAASSFASARRMSVSPSKSLEVKMKAKQAEADALLLRNRIHRLKIEEDKALKKIEETKKRAQEILNLKLRNKMVLDAKEKARREAEDLLLKQKTEFLRRKHDSENYKRDVLETQLEQKRRAAEEAKKKRMEHEELVRLRREEEQRNLQKVCDMVRRQEERTKVVKEKQVMLYQAQLEKHFYESITNKEAEKERVENAVANMEEEEERLIERLTKMQEMQRQAYSELESALYADPVLDSPPVSSQPSKKR